jgi:G3E family GTPase
VVDIEQVFVYIEYLDVEMYKLHQIGFSDMFILNNVVPVDDEQLQNVKKWTNSIIRRVRKSKRGDSVYKSHHFYLTFLIDEIIFLIRSIFSS